MASTIELLLLAQLSGPGTPAYAQTDTTSLSPGNVTSPSAITKSWSMLPGTPQAGQVYQIATEFTGTWEAVALSLQVSIAGTWTAITPAVGAGSWASATPVAGWLVATFRVLSSATARFSLAGAMGETSASVTTSNTLAIAPVSQTLAVAASDALALGYAFASSAAGQGLTTGGSTFTRLA